MELQQALRDCSVTANKLLSLLEQDRADMPGCVNGEILAAYLRGLDEVTHTVDAIKRELSVLQTL